MFASGGGEGMLTDTLAVTASTGIAAFQLGGSTVHSFAGVGLGQGTVASLLTKIRSNKKAYARWLALKHLIIDEGRSLRCLFLTSQVSMLDGDLFSKLDQVARSLRRSTQPFGGIQVRCPLFV